MTWEIGLSLLSLGMLDVGQVHELATIALERSLDSPRLRRLADFQFPDGAESLGDLRDELTHVGVQVPERAAAAQTLGKTISAAILRGQIDAVTGARILFLASTELGHDFHMFDPFVHAYSEYDERPDEQDMIRQWIVDEATHWVEHGRGSVDGHSS